MREFLFRKLTPGVPAFQNGKPQIPAQRSNLTSGRKDQ